MKTVRKATGNSSIQHATDFSAQRRMWRRLGFLVGHVGTRRTALRHVPLAELDDDAVPLLLAQPHQSLIDHNAREPGAQLRAATEVSDVAIRIEVGILQRVFGLGIVPENRPGDAEQPGVVPPHQRLEGPVIVARYARYQLGIVGAGGCGRGSLWHDWDCPSSIRCLDRQSRSPI